MNENRPSPIPIFANNSGNIASPSNAKLTDGYSSHSELPSAEYNYTMHELSNMISYLESAGIALYSDKISYFKDARVRSSTGDVHVSKNNDNLNHNPALDTAEEFWVNESKLLRDLKNYTDNTFLRKNETAVNADKLNGNDSSYFAKVGDGVPIGAIIMWGGLVSQIPKQWALCDGNDGRPDLVDKFVYGTNSDDSVKTTGGSADAIVVEHSHDASHGHNVGNTNSTGNHKHSVRVGRAGDNNGSWSNNEVGKANTSSYKGTISGAVSYAGTHSHNVVISSTKVTTSSSGTSAKDKNLPPYIKLAFIVKVE
jgi:hypothetical protein